MPKKKFWNNDMEAIIGIVLVLVVLGSINVFSSSFVIAEADYGTPYFFLKKHAIFAFVGGIIFVAIAFFIDYHKWRNWMPLILGGTVVALLLVLLIGPPVNGARRWLPLGPIQMQPAEMAKLVSIMITAAYLAQCVNKGEEATLFNRQMALVAPLFALTELEPDMGTACIIIGVPLFMMFVVGMKKRDRWLLFGLVAIGVPLMCIIQPYRLQRIMVTWDPWSDAQNIGYQTVQSLSAIGSGELWGMGLGVGVSKYDYLPEAHTDFAFAIFCQENGFVGALFVFLLYAALTVYSARVANKAEDAYGQILAMGILLLIVGQAIANLLMVGGAFPVVGVPLPFISYGGTSLLVSMTAVAILVNIGKRGDEYRKRREHEEEEAEAVEEEFAARMQDERYRSIHKTRLR